MTWDLAREGGVKGGRKRGWRRTVLLLGGALLLVPAPALRAQVNTERLRRSVEQPGVSGSAGLNALVRTGNVSLVLLSSNARVDYDAGRWIVFLVGTGDVGWQDGERFSNAGLLHFRQGWLARPWLQPETFEQIDYDRSRSLSFRALLGGGPRFNLLRGPLWHLSLGTAVMFEHEELDLPPGSVHPRQTDVLRWSNYLTASAGEGRRVAAVFTVYAQPRFSDFGDVHLLADGRLAVQLTGTLSLTQTLNLRYDSRPPDATRSLDTTWQTGLAVEW